MVRNFLMRRLLTAILSLLASDTIAAEEKPGLILTLNESDARPARQVALFVPKGQPPSAFTAPGQIRATWTGNLNLDARSRLIFTLEGTGEANLTIGGDTLCDKISTPSEEKRLSSGSHPIKIEFTGPTDADSQLRLFWEGRDFIKEPIPATAFTHDPDSSPLLAKQSQLRQGHQLIEDHHCAACHGGEIPEATPSLKDIGSRIDTYWIARWIADPKAHRPSARMPKLLPFESALDIAFFLAPPDKDKRAPDLPTDKEQIKAGGHLFYEQGCIGCHTLGKHEDGRISLFNIGFKFRPHTLASFLREPNRHHPNTRMPDFGFDETESGALAAFLMGQTDFDPPQIPGGTAPDPLRGKTLFKQVGCTNCHDSSDELKSELPPTIPLSDLTSPNCKAADYAFTESESLAIAAALASGKMPTRPDVEFAEHQFTALRCNACHQRDDLHPFREQFAAEVAHLKPPEPPADEEKPGAHKAEIPHLNYLGFKLNPAARENILQRYGRSQNPPLAQSPHARLSQPRRQTLHWLLPRRRPSEHPTTIPRPRSGKNQIRL